MAYALITGASGGIGLCMARELAKRKIDLLLIARSSDQLSTICEKLMKEFGIQADYLSLDLSDAASVPLVMAWLKEKSYAVNILINNAGYGIWGAVESTPIEKINNMMQLNMNAVVNLSYVLLPELKRHPKSFLLNVASLSENTCFTTG